MTSLEHNSDEELMISFQKGDDRAFDELVKRYQSRIFNYIHRHIFDIERSEEVAQEVFIRVFRSRDRYQPSAKFATFVYRIALNLSFNEVRNRNRRKTDVVEDVSGTPDLETPGTLLERSEVETEIWAAIESLPPKYRDVVKLCDVEQLSYKDAGDVLEISVGTVQSRLARGRQKLREKLAHLMPSSGKAK